MWEVLSLERSKSGEVKGPLGFGLPSLLTSSLTQGLFIYTLKFHSHTYRWHLKRKDDVSEDGWTGSGYSEPCCNGSGPQWPGQEGLPILRRWEPTKLKVITIELIVIVPFLWVTYVVYTLTSLILILFRWNPIILGTLTGQVWTRPHNVNVIIWHIHGSKLSILHIIALLPVTFDELNVAQVLTAWS